MTTALKQKVLPGLTFKAARPRQMMEPAQSFTPTPQTPSSAILHGTRTVGKSVVCLYCGNDRLKLEDELRGKHVIVEGYFDYTLHRVNFCKDCKTAMQKLRLF